MTQLWGSGHPRQYFVSTETTLVVVSPVAVIPVVAPFKQAPFSVSTFSAEATRQGGQLIADEQGDIID